MPIHSPRLARASLLCGLGLVGAFGPACKRSVTAPAPSGAPSAASSVTAVEEPSHCRRRSDFGLALEAPPAPVKKGEPAETDDEDDSELLPFGVDIGAALPTPFGFAVAGIEGEGRAFVALLAARASRRIDLGVVHGDPETPAVASIGERVLVALRSTDAAGFTLKLGSISGPESGAVQWGYELSKLGKSVTGVELAADAQRGLLVYQGELKGEPRLMLGSFSTTNLAEPVITRPLDVKDVEMPRLVHRPGGYWLSWVRTLPEPKKAGASGGAARAEQDPEERELLEVGLRVLEVAKLDAQGALLGAPLRAFEPRRQVLLYDVAPWSGGLLVAARADSAAPGAEGGAILLRRVGQDGSVNDERLEDDEIGAGAPALLFDAAESEHAPWLSVSAPNDATRIGVLQGERTSLRADPLLGKSEVIAAAGERFLLQRARGRAVTLETLDCSWPAENAAAK